MANPMLEFLKKGKTKKKGKESEKGESKKEEKSETKAFEAKEKD